MVGSVIKVNLDFLTKLALTKSQQVRMELIQNATQEELLAILETCINVLKFRFPLKQCQKNRLRPHAARIRQVARKRTPDGVRKILKLTSGDAYKPLLLPVINITRKILHHRAE